MRIQNSIRNTVFGVLKTIIQMGLKFVVRIVFTRILGEEFLGLDSLFVSILQVLSLADLGFGSVIVYTMYKPVAENDNRKIAALLLVYKKIYFIVGGIILIIGGIITPFITFFIKDDVPSEINIYIVFIVFLFNTVIGYFFSYKRSLLYANQRNDIESKIGSVCVCFLYLVQITVLLLFKNYYSYIFFMPIFTLAENVIVSVIIKKMYPNIGKGETLGKVETKTIIKQAFAMLCHNIGSVVVFSTDNILISSFLGLLYVGRYNNYYLVISTIITLFNIFTNAFTASVGNSVAVEDVETNYRNFKNLSFICFWIINFSAICLFVLLTPFVTFCFGDNTVLNSVTVLLMVTSFVLSKSRNLISVYRNTTGTFWNDRYKSLAEAAVNLLVSLILVHYLGLNGIILGTIISSVFVALPIEAFVVYKHYFHKNVLIYLLFYLLNLLFLFCVGALTWYVCSIIQLRGVWLFVVQFLICLVLPNVAFTILTIKTNEFQYCKRLFFNILRKIFHRKPNVK